MNTLLSIARQSPTGTPQSEGSLVQTVRIGAATVSMPADIVLPQFDAGYANTTINGVEYRVRTVTTGSNGPSFQSGTGRSSACLPSRQPLRKRWPASPPPS